MDLRGWSPTTLGRCCDLLECQTSNLVPPEACGAFPTASVGTGSCPRRAADMEVISADKTTFEVTCWNRAVPSNWHPGCSAIRGRKVALKVALSYIFLSFFIFHEENKCPNTRQVCKSRCCCHCRVCAGKLAGREISARLKLNTSFTLY